MDSPGTTTPSTATASTSSSSEKDEYAISDDAMRSLRNSRNGRSRGTLPVRSASTGSNKSGTGGGAAPVNNNTNNSNNALPSPHQQRASNRSSANSLWSSLMKNGRRIYGSTASVASSITCTEFDDFNVSDHSLDIRNFDNIKEAEGNDQEHVDERPQIPQRQTSLPPTQQSFGLLSISEHSQRQQQHLSSSSLGKIDEQPQPSSIESPPPPPPSDHPLRGSTNTTNTASTDLSPKQPGRKVSITDAGVRSSGTGVSRTLSNDSSSNHTKNNNPSSCKTDEQPSHPCRKQSNILVSQNEGIILEEAEEDASSVSLMEEPT